jgi:thiamine-phosphate diphosphorylase
VRNTVTRVVVNDRLDVALTSGADGVHLRADSIPPEAARAIAPPGFLIGRSVHSLDEAVDASAGVDYLIAGTVYPSASKPGMTEMLGLHGLAEIAGAVHVPVLGIGGITIDRLGDVARAGAAGVAAIGLFVPVPPVGIGEAARSWFDRVDTAS